MNVKKISGKKKGNAFPYHENLVYKNDPSIQSSDKKKYLISDTGATG